MDKLSIRNLILIIILVVALGVALFFAFFYHNGTDSNPGDKHSPSASTEASEDQHSIITDKDKYYHEPVLIAANGSIDSGSGANAWRGMCEYLNVDVKTGAEQYKDAYYICEDDKQSILNLIDELENPSSVVPNIIFLTGKHAAEAVEEAQMTYIGTNFVLLESTLETPAENTCCISFANEQAGFLAGYSCVMEGASRIRFAAETQNDQTMEYYYGFLQGVDQAAKNQSARVTVSTSFTLEAAHAVRDGSPQIVFACGSTRFQKQVIDNAEQAGVKVVCSDIDYSYLYTGSRMSISPICASTVNNYGAIITSILTAYASEGWSQFYAGKQLRYDLSLGNTLGMSATANAWHYEKFDAGQYYQVLGALSSGGYTATLEEPLMSEWVTLTSLDPVEEDGF